MNYSLNVDFLLKFRLIEVEENSVKERERNENGSFLFYRDRSPKFLSYLLTFPHFRPPLHLQLSHKMMISLL